MKIVQILFNKNFGGVEQCFVDYCEVLTLLGHSVYNLIQKDAKYKGALSKISNNIYEFDTKHKLNPINILKIRILIKKIKPDIIICHTGKSAIINKVATFGIKKFPIIGVDHGERPMNYIKHNKADYVFCVNTWLMKQINDLNIGVKAFNIPNMIRIENGFQPPRKKWHDPPVVGILSRLSYEKFIEKIILAVAILRERGIETEFVIGGTGLGEEFLKNLTETLKLQKSIKFKGWITDKKQFFEQIDIFCMPSFKETFGIAYLDAMKYNTPVIASNTWGPSDIFEHEKNGLIISRDNPDVMQNLIADAIERLINDKELAEKIAKNGFETAKKKYTIEANSKLIKQAIDIVMNDYKNKIRKKQ